MYTFNVTPRYPNFVPADYRRAESFCAMAKSDATAADDAGYCLDAPSRMPAGSMTTSPVGTPRSPFVNREVA